MEHVAIATVDLENAVRVCTGFSSDIIASGGGVGGAPPPPPRPPPAPRPPPPRAPPPPPHPPYPALSSFLQFPNSSRTNTRTAAFGTMR